MEKDDMSLRVDSFSCYLNSVQEKAINSSTKPPPPFSIMFSKSQDSLANLRLDSIPDTTGKFVFEIPGPVEDPTSAFTFSREIPKDGEIGVFNADRYFNMKLEYSKPEPKIKCETQLPQHSKLSSRFSEASSAWNSQTPLMIPDNIRRSELKKQKKAMIGKKILMRLRCKGFCFDKNSIAEKNRTIKIEPSDDSRPSIEVFGSSNRMKSDVATKMERKLSMLTWDAIPKDKTAIPTPPMTACDDMASEASSDLFEIENISGSTNFQLADDTSTCMSPSSVYAPSEASIQWSVVTASAAGYSVLSEFNEETSASVAGELILRSVEGKNGKTKYEGVQKNRSGGILGCKNQRAAEVVCQKSGLGLDGTKQGKSGYSYPSIL